MELKLDHKKMEQSIHTEYKWVNGRPYIVPLYFSCISDVPCEMTTHFPLFKPYGNKDILSDETISSIKESLEDIEHGRTRSLEEISREMGI